MTAPSARDDVTLADAFKKRYSDEKAVFDRLGASLHLRPGEKKMHAVIAAIAKSGVVAYIRKKKPEQAAEVRASIEDFVRYGAKSILLTGSQRGGDFLNNQLRGSWAERVACSLKLPGVHIVPFGPSGAAMPGDEDHRQVVSTYRQIVLLEGKRPDLLGFDQAVWNGLSKAERDAVATWPERTLDATDEALVRRAVCGIEVKNSTWHYDARRKAGKGPLSITVKVEEVEDIQSWSKRTGLPVLFFQVLFDEMYCMSFDRMLIAIDKGFLYRAGTTDTPGDYLKDKDTGAGGKVYHRFFLEAPLSRHLLGRVVFPSRSEAVVRVLTDGNVVPYIKFEPAETTDPREDIFGQELNFRQGGAGSTSRQSRAP